MSFLAPLGLLALLALPFIVILHMLRERRRRVVVPSLLLWQLLPQRQAARRRRRPPLSLLLLLHLLAAALLGLALAQPQWSLALFGGERHTVAVIDNSTSMAAPGPGLASTRLDAVRAQVRQLVSGMGSEETLTLIATSPHSRLLESAGPAGAARLLVALDGLSAAGTGSDLAGALTLAETALQGRPGARVLVLSDAALPQSQLDALTARSAAVPVEWRSVGGELDNLAVVTLAARPRGASGLTQVYARAVNYGGTPVRTLLRLFGDEVLLDTRPVTLASRGEVELTWSVPRGVTMLRAELDGNDGLPADDTAWLSLEQARPVRALLVAAQPAALERALHAVPGLTLSTLEPADYAGSPMVDEADLTIFDGYLPAAWPAGGVLVINPPVESPLLTVGAPSIVQDDLRADLASPALLSGLSLESVDFGPLSELEPPVWASTLLAQDDQPLILRGRSAASEVAIWAFDLGQSNLTTRLAFPLLVARTVRDLTPQALPGAALVGKTLTLRPDPRATRVELAAPDASVTVLRPHPGEDLLLSLDQPGLYMLAEQDERRTLFNGRLGVNAGAPVESDLNPQTLPAGSTLAATSRAEGDLARPLWPWLVVLALVVMLIEWMYVHGRRYAPGEVS